MFYRLALMTCDSTAYVDGVVVVVVVDVVVFDLVDVDIVDSVFVAVS